MNTAFNEVNCLNYNPFDGDFGEPGDKILSDKIVTTVGGSKCCECLSTTKKGERNRVLKAVFGGELKSYRWCSACCHAFSLAFDHDDDDDDAFDRAMSERNAVREKNMKGKQ